MSVKTVIDLPEDIYRTLSSHGFSRNAISKESKKLLALKCYKEKILSLGKSAELSGFSLWEFTEFLSENNVSVVDYNEELLKKEIDDTEELRKALKR